MYQTLNSSGVKMGRVKVDGNIEKKKQFSEKQKKNKNKQTNKTLTFPNLFWTNWA